MQRLFMWVLWCVNAMESDCIHDQQLLIVLFQAFRKEKYVH